MPYFDDLLYFQELMNAGGVVMWLILGCSIIGLFIVVERLLVFHRAQIDAPEFLHGLFNVLKRNNTVEAVAICDETPGPVARVLRSAILRCDQDESALRSAVEDASLLEVPRLERNLKALATVAQISPLLGLLGSVLGMMGAFHVMQEVGPFVSTADLAVHVRKALLTTAAGLSVAIPAYAFYNFLVARLESIVLDMEKAANEMVYFLTHTEAKLDRPVVADGAAQKS
jgi:biopolymer transport protein ExbB